MFLDIQGVSRYAGVSGYTGCIWIYRVLLDILGVSGYTGYFWIYKVFLNIQGVSGYTGCFRYKLSI